MPDTMMQPEAAPVFRNRSASIAAIAAALAAAQKAFAPIPKDREVTVKMENGGTYKFRYATLDAIRNSTMPALAEQSLAVSQALTTWGEHYAIETALYHSSGEWMSNVTPMFVSGRRGRDGKEFPPGNQELGSAQTYARRYGISALLCITADEDDDGNSADGNHAEGSERVPFKPGARGTAGGGTQFRPERRQQSAWGTGGKAAVVEDARKDGLVKPGVPINTPAAAKNAVEQMQWIKDARKVITEAETKAALSDWWRQNEEGRETASAAVPVEFDKLIVLFDEKMTAVAQAGA